MDHAANNQESTALRLIVAIKRLRARVREVAPEGVALPIAQLSIIQHLRREGPATAATLAAAEHVSEQAIAQNLRALKQAGLVRATPDPSDGRKSLISVSDAGHRMYEAVLASRSAWLVQAIDKTISADELPALEKAITLLERLAAER